MFSAKTYQDRRQGLIQQLNSGLVILLGNEYSSKNYKDNHFPFRQDSSFLYYIGINQAHLAATIDIEAGETCLYGDDVSVEMIVWTGPQPNMRDLGQQSGIQSTKAYSALATSIQAAKSAGRTIHVLPPYRPENSILLAHLLACPLSSLSEYVSTSLIKAIVHQRSIKSAEELAEMAAAVNISRKMHVAAMQQAQAGQIEAELAGLVEGIASAGGGQLSYPVILTINGQTLHNHYHGNTLQDGQLVLGDFGAETAMGYAGDITRTFPVAKRFSSQQKDIYEIVLEAETQVIKQIRPGIPYLDMHKLSARIITDGLKALGLMKGDTNESVEAGAHSLFFPHGLGHMIGLDVHDMEDLGEDLVGYDEQIKRNPMFGYKSLRLGRNLESGFVLTVEPGIYFIPELIDSWRAQGLHQDFINYDKLDAYKTFGGVRIEDDVLVTDTGSEVLGDPIPKTVAEVEALRS